MEGLAKKINFWYYQYLLHTALYMLNPTERKVFSILSKELITEPLGLGNTIRLRVGVCKGHSSSHQTPFLTLSFKNFWG